MKTKEEEVWINTLKSTRGQCENITQEMSKAFPELTRVRGTYWCPIWGKREHWWLKDTDGRVVDPTAEQFPSKGHGEYEEWDETQPEPTGKCLNCGEYCFNGNYFCSEECRRTGLKALKRK